MIKSKPMEATVQVEEADEDISVGDIVELNSGGPKMTVTDILPSGADGQLIPDRINCRWSLDDTYFDKLFNPITLKIISHTSPNVLALKDYELKIGDVVQLNSSGPEMTVFKLSAEDNAGNNEEGWITCIWFTYDFEYMDDIFPEEAVSLVNEK